MIVGAFFSPPFFPPCPFNHTSFSQDPLIRGDISKVAVLILDANGALLERFVADLKVRRFCASSVQPRKKKKKTSQKQTKKTQTSSFSFHSSKKKKKKKKVQAEILASVEPEDVEAALRSALLKLQRSGDGAFGGGIEGEEENDNARGGAGGAAGGALRPLPKGCTFEVVAHARSRDALPRDAWVDADPVAAAAAAAAAARRRGSPVLKDAAVPDDDGGGGDDNGGDDDERTSSLLLPPRGVLPLKSARAGGGALRLQVYVEGVA